MPDMCSLCLTIPASCFLPPGQPVLQVGVSMDVGVGMDSSDGESGSEAGRRYMIHLKLKRIWSGVI